jgi:hypothetical protein
MIGVRVTSVGVLGPGLQDWATASAVLSGRARHVMEPIPDPSPALLPANERRRASATVRWALAAGHEALAASGLPGEDVATVFVSCGGDGQTTHQICDALAAPTREVSPTRFHNSVHNAPAGYWCIATRSLAPSTSLCGYEASFAVGLLEAAAQTTEEARAVLMIAYDLPYPQPMHALWPISQPFAVALMLEPASATGTQLYLAVRPGDARLSWPDVLPRALSDNPAAHAAPILAVLARREHGALELPYLQGSHVGVEVRS